MSAYYGGKDPFADAVSPVEDPTVLSQMTSVMAAAVQHTTIGEAPPEVVHLPVPIEHAGTWINKATVRELNGGDEEALARAAASGPQYVLDKLLELGVAGIGGQAPTAEALRALPIADRDALLVGIRVATYGPEVKMTLGCSKCGKDIELTYDLNDVPARPAMPVGNVDLQVPLRRGGTATLRLPNGDDQIEIIEAIERDGLTRPQQDTALLARCLKKIIDTSGKEIPVTGEETARALSIPDRTALLTALDEARPGPRLDEAKVTCPWCSEETEVPLSWDILFRA